MYKYVLIFLLKTTIIEKDLLSFNSQNRTTPNFCVKTTTEKYL